MSASPLRSISSPWRRVRRFVVADRSMEPTLVHGQGLIAISAMRATPGQLRCLEHPAQPGFWLVKRVESVDGTTMRVMSDNVDVDAVDSRRFGPVPVAGSYRVVLTVPRRLM
ncbi:MAG: S26 family signal peptidase [Ilumatobacter sp.]|uniref:S26 family signal peptidase n=1 Tax=Ilumatobacter sp. TaxID=1967498 RepID=UPI00329A71C3